MAVIVKYFAALREELGRSEERIEHHDGLTVISVWEQVAGGRVLEESVLTAVNLDYVGDDYPVADGDEVAFFPPVTGG